MLRPPVQAEAPADGLLTVAALAERLATIPANPDGGLAVLIAGDASGRAAGLALAVGRRLAAHGRAALVDLGDAPDRPSESVVADNEDGAAGLAELLDGRASFAEALHRDHASRLDLVPAGVGAIDIEALRPALDALAANCDFLVMHAYDWRSPAAERARARRRRAGDCRAFDADQGCARRSARGACRRIAGGCRIDERRGGGGRAGRLRFSRPGSSRLSRAPAVAARARLSVAAIA